MKQDTSEFSEYIITADYTIRDVMEHIDRSEAKTAIMLNDEGVLLGVVTDADIRHGLINGKELNNPALEILNQSPIVAKTSMTPTELEQFIRRQKRAIIPVVDDDGRVVAVRNLLDSVGVVVRPNTVVIMAGGKGTRLMPHTKHTPKPMLKVGPKPVLEIIVEEFIRQGFYKFVFAVNYLSEVIVDHFGDGAKWDCKIQYLHEDEPLGTAGALSLLDADPKHPIIVTNGDILAHINYDTLLSFHKLTKSAITICTQKQDIPIAYGVVESDGYRFIDIVEKPTHQISVSAGIYVLESEALKLIESNVAMDMPALFLKANEQGYKVCTFPLDGYWLDVGQLDDWQKAHDDYSLLFNASQD